MSEPIAWGIASDGRLLASYTCADEDSAFEMVGRLAASGVSVNVVPLFRQPAITSGEEMTMTDEKTNDEPSAASAGSLANAHSARKDAEAKIIADGIAEIMRIASEPEWIPVTERLPQPWVNVLITVRGEYVFMGCCTSGGGWRGNCDMTQEGVTHWMPLPFPPNEAT